MAKKLTSLAVILAGGSGTRLAPLSLTFGNNLPKQFLALAKKRTMIQEAVNRIPEGTDVLIVPEEKYKEVTALQTENTCAIIAEPFGCNTAAAIGLAAVYALQKGYDEDTVLFVLPADHYMDTRLFRKYVTPAVAAAAKGKIVTIGITPSRPETGYGYINANKKLQNFFGTQALYEVIEFVEKPSLDVAKKYCEAGTYFWNSGMFAFSVRTILRALETHAPVIFNAVQNIRTSLGTPQEMDAIRREYQSIKDAKQNISIDYAVMEKEAKNILLLPAETKLNWNDVGGWIALEQYCKEDAAKNRAFNKVEFAGATDVFALNYRTEHILHIGGLHEMLAVSTNNGLFICPKALAQRSKEIIPGLEKGEKLIQIDSANNEISNTTDIPVALVGCEGLKIEYAADKVTILK